MQDFPPNSRMARETEPPENIEPVTTAETVRRKRGLGRQFKETFFQGTGRDVIGYMVEDVVVPAIRDTLYNAWQGGLDKMIYGDSRGGRRRSTGPLANSSTGHVAYDRISKSQSASPPQRILSGRSRARHDFDDIIIDSMKEAHEVIDRLFDVLSMYGQVSVAQLYALTGIRAEHTDNKWGWTNLKGSRAVRLADGRYLLDLPRPEELRYG
jgi:hypothetical protein